MIRHSYQNNHIALIICLALHWDISLSSQRRLHILPINIRHIFCFIIHRNHQCCQKGKHNSYHFICLHILCTWWNSFLFICPLNLPDNNYDIHYVCISTIKKICRNWMLIHKCPTRATGLHGKRHLGLAKHNMVCPLYNASGQSDLPLGIVLWKNSNLPVQQYAAAASC